VSFYRLSAVCQLDVKMWLRVRATSRYLQLWCGTCEFDECSNCHTTSGIQPTKIMAMTIHTAMKKGSAKIRFAVARSRGAVRSWR
jgi:hypothetical protein